MAPLSARAVLYCPACGRDDAVGMKEPSIVSESRRRGGGAWLNAPVLKTGIPSRVSWVRIPPPPQQEKKARDAKRTGYSDERRPELARGRRTAEKTGCERSEQSGFRRLLREPPSRLEPPSGRLNPTPSAKGGRARQAQLVGPFRWTPTRVRSREADSGKDRQRTK